MITIKGKMKVAGRYLNTIELFNLNNDHKELHNQLGEQPAIESKLTKALEDFLAAPRKRWE